MGSASSNTEHQLVMSIVLYQKITLIDALKVCFDMPQDEREQYEAFSLDGSKYDPEQAAVEFFARTGPKWTLCDGTDPIAIAGFDYLRNGVWQDWMVSTPKAWDKQHWFHTTRQVRRVMDSMLGEVAHRLQCISLRSRIHAHEWYGVLGLRQEGVLEAYGVSGEDALLFSRVRKAEE